jgi:hypothetical protein
MVMSEYVKRGGPVKPTRLKRTARLQLLLTAGEHKALNQYAARQELTVSEIVRGCVRQLLSAEAEKEEKQ